MLLQKASHALEPLRMSVCLPLNYSAVGWRRPAAWWWWWRGNGRGRMGQNRGWAWEVTPNDHSICGDKHPWRSLTILTIMRVWPITILKLCRREAEEATENLVAAKLVIFTTAIPSHGSLLCQPAFVLRIFVGINLMFAFLSGLWWS